MTGRLARASFGFSSCDVGVLHSCFSHQKHKFLLKAELRFLSEPDSQCLTLAENGSFNQ